MGPGGRGSGALSSFVTSSHLLPSLAPRVFPVEGGLGSRPWQCAPYGSQRLHRSGQEFTPPTSEPGFKSSWCQSGHSPSTVPSP